MCAHPADSREAALLKVCELCGLENPDEARFCMKCGKDLDAVEGASTADEIELGAFTPGGDVGGAFTPAGDYDAAPLSPQKKPVDRGPTPDMPTFRRSGPPVVDEHEKFSTVPDYGDEPPEIQLTDVAADFAEKQQYCDRCGMANPREQKYCRQCGSALQGADGREADAAFDRASAVPLAKEPVEPTLLAPVSGATSSDYYADEGRDSGMFRRGFGFGGGLRDWDVKEWGILSAVVILIVLLVWLFAFGGLKMFTGGNKTFNGAVDAMSELASYEYNISGTLEDADGNQTPCSGNVKHSKPDRSLWQFNGTIPSLRSVTTQLAQVGEQPFSNGGGGWKKDDPSAVSFDSASLWQDYSNLEELGGESADTQRFTYNAPPEIFSSLLGNLDPTGVAQARVEAVIDTKSNRIVRLTAKVYNVPVDQAKVTMVVTFDLATTDQTYNIGPPL